MLEWTSSLNCPLKSLSCASAFWLRHDASSRSSVFFHLSVFAIIILLLYFFSDHASTLRPVLTDEIASAVVFKNTILLYVCFHVDINECSVVLTLSALSMTNAYFPLCNCFPYQCPFSKLSGMLLNIMVYRLLWCNIIVLINI